MFKPVEERILIKDILVKEITKAILDKKYIPGSKLPTEEKLCEQFNVSRTSVREAIQILSARGLVNVEKGRGIFVNKITSDSVVDNILQFLEHRFEGDYFFDLIHARQIIEPGIAYLAALNRTDEDLIKMKKDIDDIDKNDGNPIKHGEYDMSFHMHLARATQNKLLPLLLKPIHKLMPEVKSKILIDVEDAKQAAVVWHSKIYDYIKIQDPDGAQKAMVAHLKIAEQHIELAVSQSAGKN